MLVRLAIAAWASLAVCGPAASADMRCENAANVSVQAQDRSDALTACAGAGEAIRFLGAVGLNVSAQINLRIVDRILGTDSSLLSGCFIPHERCAYLLTFSKLIEQGTPFDLPVDRALYQSLATHEVAHVIAAQNFAVAKPRIEAHEYIAYVTTLGTMQPGHRGVLLARFPAQDFRLDMEINTFIYLFDPVRFGVLAYRHFLKDENGKAFVERVLTGRALTEGN